MSADEFRRMDGCGGSVSLGYGVGLDVDSSGGLDGAE